MGYGPEAFAIFPMGGTIAAVDDYLALFLHGIDELAGSLSALIAIVGRSAGIVGAGKNIFFERFAADDAVVNVLNRCFLRRVLVGDAPMPGITGQFALWAAQGAVECFDVAQYPPGLS